MSNLRNPVLLLDFQTTGMRPTSSRILEIGWCIFSNGEPGTVESRLIRQSEPLPARIREITGIGDQELLTAVEEKDALADLFGAASKLGGRPRVIAHYAQFERAFFDEAKERLGLELDVEWICSQKIGKRLFPELPSQNLKALAGFFGSQLLDLNRAAQHVKATVEVWRSILARLAERKMEDWPSLETWLAQKTKTESRYQYRVEKLQRLALPDRPGIYRMLARDGKILYVGKATSLKSRVNSYFRGQKGRDRRKLEMLTQVWDLRVTECETPTEAALLETDEIKKWNPPYNVSLKAGDRALLFYNRDFSEVSESQSAQFPIGPFRPSGVLDSLRLLNEWLTTGVLRLIFYQEIDPDLLASGFERFCVRQTLQRDQASRLGMRGWIALGTRNLRKFRREYAEDLEVVFAKQKKEKEPEAELTADDVAGKFERLILRSAASIRHARRLTQLLNCHVTIGERRLFFRDGKLENSEFPPSRLKFQWEAADIADYDRMSVLLSEVERRGFRVTAYALSPHSARPDLSE